MVIFLSHLLTKFITNGAALSDFIPTFARSIKLSFAKMAKWWTFFLTKKTQKGIALFRPWRRGKDGCITTFKSLLIESEESKCFGKFKLNPCTYCSLLLYFLDCFVHNQCITFRLNKPKHSGDGAKRSPFLNTTIMHFCCFFCMLIRKLFLFTLTISNFEWRSIILVLNRRKSKT